MNVVSMELLLFAVRIVGPAAPIHIQSLEHCSFDPCSAGFCKR